MEEEQPQTSSGLSSPVKRGGRRGKQDVGRESKVIIYRVYSFIKNISENPEELANINFKRAQDLTAKMCGVHPNTVRRICKEVAECPEGEGEPIFSPPRKAYKRKCYVTNINDCDKEVLRQAVYEMFVRGEYPTISKLRKTMAEKTGFSGSESSLLRILKNINANDRESDDEEGSST